MKFVDPTHTKHVHNDVSATTSTYPHNLFSASPAFLDEAVSNEQFVIRLSIRLTVS